MTKIKFLKAQFTDSMEPWEIPAFRGAIVAKVGRTHHWFHNHLDDNKFLYRYPKIQYKCINHRPMLLCVHEGVDEVHKLFEQPDWSINISQRNLELRIDRLEMHEFDMKVNPQWQSYHIKQWVGLNQKNYEEYQQLGGLVERITFLEKKLVAHIISFAKGINWHIDKRFEVKITDLSPPRWVKVKDSRLLGFNISFDSQVFLPDFVGLGRKVSIGYGVVRRTVVLKKKY